MYSRLNAASDEQDNFYITLKIFSQFIVWKCWFWQYRESRYAAYFPLFCYFSDRKAISSTCSICPFHENKIYELFQFVLSLIYNRVNYLIHGIWIGAVYKHLNLYLEFKFSLCPCTFTSVCVTLRVELELYT